MRRMGLSQAAVVLVTTILAQLPAPFPSNALSVTPAWDYFEVDPGAVTRTLTLLNDKSYPITITNPRIYLYGGPRVDTLELESWTTGSIAPGATGQVVVSATVSEPIVLGGILRFESGDEVISASFYLGFIVADGSESHELGMRALEAYEWARDQYEQGSAAYLARENNRGVLNVSLGYYDHDFWGVPLVRAYEAAFGYRTQVASVAMNLGVYYSRPGQTNMDPAISSFATALAHVDESSETSVLTPMIYYNQARRRYLQDDGMDEALAKVDEAALHPNASERLKLKCQALRGAIQIRRGEHAAALADFESVHAADPGGPIGRIADGFLELWDVAEFNVSMFQNPAVPGRMNLVVVRQRGASHFGAALVADGTTTQVGFHQLTRGVFHGQFILEDATDASAVVVFRASSGRDTTVVRPFSAARRNGIPDAGRARGWSRGACGIPGRHLRRRRSQLREAGEPGPAHVRRPTPRRGAGVSGPPQGRRCGRGRRGTLRRGDPDGDGGDRGVRYVRSGPDGFGRPGARHSDLTQLLPEPYARTGHDRVYPGAEW